MEDPRSFMNENGTEAFWEVGLEALDHELNRHIVLENVVSGMPLQRARERATYHVGH